MEYWKNPEECVTAVKKIWEDVEKDPELREGARKVNQLYFSITPNPGPDAQYGWTAAMAPIRLAPEYPQKHPI